jgi:hypothetical protein
VRKELETIKAKVIPINSLPKDIRKVFSHMGKQERMYSEEQLKLAYLAGYDMAKGISKITSKQFIQSLESKQEEMKEGELTEKCWAGYTQKGMKTMFGKRYPNCVKKTK